MTTRDYWRMTTRDYWRLPEITGFVARTLYAIWKSQERLQYGCISSILRTINSYFCRVITSSQSCSQLSRATSSFPELLPAPQGYYQLSRAVTSSPELLPALQSHSSPELLPAPQGYYQLSLTPQVTRGCGLRLLPTLWLDHCQAKLEFDVFKTRKF